MIEVLSDPHQIAAEWRRLWHRAGAAPFQSPAWLLPWWRQFGTGRARIAALRGRDGLLGVLPLYDLPGKTLPLGAGVTDLQDALLAPEAPREAAALLLAAGLRGAGLPCHLPDLPPHAALLEAAAPAGWACATQADVPCPVLVLPGEVPARRRRKLRMARHRAERAGGWSFTEDAEALPALLALHAARWGDGGVLADARMSAFLRDAVRALGPAARVFVLRVAGDVAAGCLALASAGRLFLYLQGYDPARAFVSPGTLLLGALLEKAIAEGICEVNFLRGAEAYKYAWGAVDRPNALRILTPP